MYQWVWFDCVEVMEGYVSVGVVCADVEVMEGYVSVGVVCADVEVMEGCVSVGVVLLCAGDRVICISGCGFIVCRCRGWGDKYQWVWFYCVQM